MKATENILAVLSANRRLAHYKGVTRRDDGTSRPYDIIGSVVTVYRDKDGNIVDPTGDVTKCRSERHSVAFDLATWDAIASVACVTDTVVVKGTLVIPEAGEKDFFQATRADKTSYLSGSLRDPMPVDHRPGVFRGGLLRKSDQIPVETKNAEPGNEFH